MRAAALLLIAPIVSGAAVAAEPLEIKGLRLGMPEFEALQILVGATCSDTLKPLPAPPRVCSDKTSTLAGHPARFLLAVRNGVVASITVIFTSEHAADVRRAAIAKYGKPRDSGGAALMWGAGDQTLVYSHDPAKGSSWIVLSSRTEREIRDKARDKDF